MKFISAQDAADKWGISKRRVQVLCASSRIENAVRIGNMWVLPETAEKPTDARRAKVGPGEKRENPIRSARSRIRAITQRAMQRLSEAGASGRDAKTAALTLFSTELLLHCIRQGGPEPCGDSRKSAAAAVARVTGHPAPQELLDGLTEQREQIQDLLAEYPFCCDDLLSWCYQYINRFGEKSPFWNTQFFTEKYMIAALVDCAGVTGAGKILDPACGGGNFLLHCLDVLAETAPAQAPRRHVDALCQRLFGYEIDRELAMAASINLRLKCLSILTNLGCTVDTEDFLRFTPNIFYPAHNTVAGALDVNPEEQRLLQCGGRDSTLSAVLGGADIIVTNPPFQTVKGMPGELKRYLKAHYPLAKCDMCNAFIQMTLGAVKPHGIVGIVSQNSWMYLDSFSRLRERLLSRYSLLHIWELGSNAFYDLSGEKANAILMLCKNDPPRANWTFGLTSLKGLEQREVERILSEGQRGATRSRQVLQQNAVGGGCAFDAAGTDHLRAILSEGAQYGAFAVPMQGTSTGNAKELIDFFWRHTGDPDWVPVSKGGGYARWRGLNHYCVKWGVEGEYIRATAGSAIRNASYFGQTRLVFSDTGTAGLNARLLLDGQIFVASGPGIRSLQGDSLAHLAFLNSRFASYYIRLLSPKLTVAAGYISKLPLSPALLSSDRLHECAGGCLEVKQRRLRKRPNNLEFEPVAHTPGTIAEHARQWFLEDLRDEWLQLSLEREIEEEIGARMALTASDLKAMELQIGTRQVERRKGEPPLSRAVLEKLMQKHLDANCVLRRTRADKRELGCDGLLEFLAQKTGASCQAVYQHLSGGAFFPPWLEEKYAGLYLHALVLSAAGYPAHAAASMSAEQIAAQAGLQEEALNTWLADSFNRIHEEALMKAPVFRFDTERQSLERLGGKLV